ncbi:hypothetical protein DUNSADRAFT_7114 [Dunaliella salina]|uniref:Encoded protein n=1 Tax=Dunaliella salina TaxID=3046 RepID=A0ABQ7FTI7_DUNSA|nr:hypothetical protein DUNSADRAFT_7114 [Dunaliella salina]|eukprot:KAF5825771.1 hypothetical protein DUNSADRAFT_7114 [Dunaliella salina]
MPHESVVTLPSSRFFLPKSIASQCADVRHAERDGLIPRGSGMSGFLTLAAVAPALSGKAGYIVELTHGTRASIFAVLHHYQWTLEKLPSALLTHAHLLIDYHVLPSNFNKNTITEEPAMSVDEDEALDQGGGLDRRLWDMMNTLHV